MNRILIHAHNALTGHIAMAKTGMQSISKSSTTSDKAKDIADQIFGLLLDLDREIRDVRIDPETKQSVDTTKLKPGDPGFQWPACEFCGSRSLRCGCD